MISKVIKKTIITQQSKNFYYVIFSCFFVIAALFVGAGFAGYGRFLRNSAFVIAAATLAIGVAGQTVVGSILGGLVLVVDPEFNIGNYIEWSEDEGEIKSIILKVTRVHSKNGELITVSNTTLT